MIAIFVLILYATCCVLFSVNYYTQNPVTKAINSVIHNIWGLWVDHRLGVQGVNISTHMHSEIIQHLGMYQLMCKYIII